MLAQQARKGWKVRNLNLLGFYRFEPAEPEEVVFDSTTVPNPPADYSEFFEAAGWKPVIVNRDFQIFKTQPGADPIFTDGSRSYWLNRQARAFGIICIILFTLLAITGYLAHHFQLGPWGIPLWFPFLLAMIVMVPVWFTACRGAALATLQTEDVRSACTLAQQDDC